MQAVCVFYVFIPNDLYTMQHGGSSSLELQEKIKSHSSLITSQGLICTQSESELSNAFTLSHTLYPSTKHLAKFENCSLSDCSISRRSDQTYHPKPCIKGKLLKTKGV